MKVSTKYHASSVLSIARSYLKGFKMSCIKVVSTIEKKFMFKLCNLIKFEFILVVNMVQSLNKKDRDMHSTDLLSH